MVITISSSKKYYIPEFIHIYIYVYFSSSLEIIIENLLGKMKKNIYIYIKFNARSSTQLDEIPSFSTKKKNTKFIGPKWMFHFSGHWALIARFSIPFSRAGSVREAALIGPGDAQMRVMACVIRTSREADRMVAAAGIYKRKERPVQRFQLSAIWLPPQLGLIVVILERPVQRFRFVLERGMRARGCGCEKKKKERSGRYIGKDGGRKYRGEEDGRGASERAERERERTRGTTPK